MWNKTLSVMDTKDRSTHRWTPSLSTKLTQEMVPVEKASMKTGDPVVHNSTEIQDTTTISNSSSNSNSNSKTSNSKEQSLVVNTQDDRSLEWPLKETPWLSGVALRASPEVARYSLSLPLDPLHSRWWWETTRKDQITGASSRTHQPQIASQWSTNSSINKRCPSTQTTCIGWAEAHRLRVKTEWTSCYWSHRRWYTRPRPERKQSKQWGVPCYRRAKWASPCLATNTPSLQATRSTKAKWVDARRDLRRTRTRTSQRRATAESLWVPRDIASERVVRNCGRPLLMTLIRYENKQTDRLLTQRQTNKGC